MHGRVRGARAVAERAVAAMVWLTRDVNALDRAVTGGAWAVRHEPASRRDLGALTVGVIGFGEIGSRVARCVSAGFGSHVVVAEIDRSAQALASRPV